MSINIRSYASGTLTLDGTDTSRTFDIDGIYGSAIAQFIASTGLQVKYYLSFDGGTTFEPVYSMDAAGTMTGADVADVIAAGDLAFFPCMGATHVRISRTAGSGTVILTAAMQGVPFTAVSGAVDTELPAAAALADNTANPTITSVGVFPHLFDGTTWDRMPGDSANGAYAYPKNGFSVQVTPTLTASPDYSALDVAGGIIEFTNVAAISGRSAKIDSLAIADKGGQTPAFTLYLFSSTPAGGTYADNGALVLDASDYAKYVGHIQVVAGDYRTPVSGSSFACVSGLQDPVPVGATSLFGLIIVDAVWNAASTSDLILTLNGERR